MKNIIKNIEDSIIGYLIIFIRSIMKIFPLSFRYIFFENLGLLSYFLLKKRRNITIKNIENVFPQKDKKEIIKIAKKSYKTMGKMIMTSMYLKEVSNDKNVYVENIEILEKLDKICDNSIILVSLHLGGFEAGSILKKLRPFYAVFRKQKNKNVNKLMSIWRKKGGLNPILLKDTEQLIKVLKEKTIIALASDHAGGDIEINFFGREVKAVGGPVLLSMKYKVPLVLVYALFDENNKIKIVVDKIIEIEKMSTMKETVKYNMQKIYKNFEEIIYKNPEQYMWQHRRWR